MKYGQAQALSAFDALSQETRLKIIRMLVKAGPEGMSAGDIAGKVAASSSSASFHLANLERARLVKSRREARSIFYSANYESLAALTAFLMEDCCARPAT
jgi:ArsR family transcriptional regulator, arsenate/arsenite/antimonite-responsive transcriptional repressor